MARIFKNSSTATGVKGRVGNMIYNSRNGEDMVMIYNNEPRTNNSEGQVESQSKWSNLTSGWTSFDSSLQGNFMDKTNSQTDYNRYMSHNMKLSDPVYLTKDIASRHGCILTNWYLSYGTTWDWKIQLTPVGDGYATDIKLGNFEIDENTTIAELAAVVVTNNSTKYAYGEDIIIYRAHQKVDADSGIPYVQTAAYEINLNGSNDAKLWDYCGTSFGLENINGYLGLSSLNEGYGFAYMHSKSVKDGSSKKKLYVSTCQLTVKNSAMLALYTGDEARARALKSYGAKTNTFSTPNSDGSSEVHGHIDEDDEPTTTYLLTVVSEDESKGTVTGGGLFEEGANPTFTAEAASGYVFEGWYRDGVKFSSANPGTLEMPDEAVEVEAHFVAETPAETYTVSLAIGEGMTGRGQVQINNGTSGATAELTGIASGTEVTIKALATDPYEFEMWSDRVSQWSRKITVTENVNLTATFVE